MISIDLVTDTDPPTMNWSWTSANRLTQLKCIYDFILWKNCNSAWPVLWSRHQIWTFYTLHCSESYPVLCQCRKKQVHFTADLCSMYVSSWCSPVAPFIGWVGKPCVGCKSPVIANTGLMPGHTRFESRLVQKNEDEDFFRIACDWTKKEYWSVDEVIFLFSINMFILLKGPF